MADVETLCRRVVLIDKGVLAYDGDLANLSAIRAPAPYKLLTVALAASPASEGPDWGRFGEVVSSEEGRVSLRVRRDDAPDMTARLLADLQVADLTVADSPLESVMDRAYREGVGV